MHTWRYIYLLLIVGLSFAAKSTFAQGETNYNDSVYNASKNYVNQYYSKQKLIEKDSLFLLNMNFLDWYTQNDTLQWQYQAIRNIVEQNRATFHVQILQNHYDSLIIKKHLYDSLRADYLQFEMLMEQLDSSHVTSSDSNFMGILDLIIDEPVVTDSLHEEDSIELELHEKYYQNDTLISAINEILKHARANEMLQWVHKIRRDTFSFYIVNIDGDSLLIPLHDSNLDLIRFNLTDYWGSSIQAIIRDINANSFKLLVDDAPSLEYETSEKALEAFEKMQRKKGQLNITAQPRELPDNTEKWQIYGNVHTDFTQVGMYQWAQGGEPTVSVLAGAELWTKYKHQSQQWDNYVRLGYGVIRQGRYEDKSENYRPNVDRIELNTKYGFKILANSNLTIEGDFKSQFSSQHEWDGNERQEKLSDFMSPAYTTLSLGIDYSKIKDLELFVSPASSRTTFVLDTALSIKQRYAVDSASTYRAEFGFRLNAKYKFKVWSNIEVQNSLELYSNYFYKPKNIDVNWEMNVIFPVNDYIRASFTTHLIYDDDQLVPKYEWKIPEDGTTNEWVKREGKGVQFKEMIKLGLTFIF